jgi:vitamin B12 transporter
MFEIPQLVGQDCFIDNIYVGYSHIDQDKKLGANEQSKYAMEYLRNKVVAKLDMHFLSHLYINLAYRWQERVGNYELFKDGKDAGKMVSYKPFSLVDAKITWNEPNYDIFVNLNNILDYTYYDHGNIPQPGIWVKAGIVYRLAL